MPLLGSEAEKLSDRDLVRGVIEEIITEEDLFALMPWVETEGKSYDYNRENTLSEGEFIDPYEVVPEEASTFTEVSTKLKILAGDVDIDKFTASVKSDKTDQISTQIAMKAKGMGRKFRRTLAIGDSSVNAKEFDGIKTLTAVDQTLSAGTNGAALTLSMLDELLDAVPNGADVIMMRPGTIRAFRALLRQSGGLEPAHVMVENFARPVLTHNGTIIIENEYMPGDETQGTNEDTCSVYAVRLNEVDGLHALFGGGPAGIVFEPIGTVQNKDAERYRLKWYCGTALKSTRSLARIKGVTNV